MRKNILLLGLISLILCACGTNQKISTPINQEIQQEIFRGEKQFFVFETRDGVTQKIFIEKYTKDPKGIVLLFSGGDGKLDLTLFANKSGRSNFVIRTRDYFLDNGYMTVMVDAPSDHSDESGMTGGFRFSNAHALDVNRIIEYLEVYKKPIWLMGTSRGTESVAYLATKLNNKIAGIILTSSITVDTRKGSSILSLPLETITKPVLITAHKDDQCFVTPASNTMAIKNALKNSIQVESKIYENGESKNNNPCKALTYHGYYEMEKEILTDILNFIGKN